MLKRLLILCGAIVAVSLVLAAANRQDDWTESCSTYEFKQAAADERFEPVHLALTQDQYSRFELRRLRQAIWEDLPLCRELVEFVSLSLQLYNDLLFVDAVPEIADTVPDPKEYDRWYELYLRVHR